MKESTWAEKLVMSGRLVADTYLAAKEHLREKSYSMTELASSQLGCQRTEVDDSLETYTSCYSSADCVFYFLFFLRVDSHVRC